MSADHNPNPENADDFPENPENADDLPENADEHPENADEHELPNPENAHPFDESRERIRELLFRRVDEKVDLSNDDAREILFRVPREGLPSLSAVNKCIAVDIGKELQYPHGLLVERERRTPQLTFDFVPLVPRTQPPFLTLNVPIEPMVYVENATNGLMLLRSGCRFYMFNPLKNFVKPLPRFERYTNLVQRGMVLCYNSLESRTSYDIVYVGERRDKTKAVEFGLFSWRNRNHTFRIAATILEEARLFARDDFGRGVYCRGHAYWVQQRGVLICFSILDNGVQSSVDLRHEMEVELVGVA
ncbi:unnamed protein product [Lactuca saligna]|uniref:Uncharacterized protein n=1 Tax=Lactuca saligna TaxID=75948 RepID=A0AA35YGQ6_LACSI|nr:unnamed protein product [Lactuca saligna]